MVSDCNVSTLLSKVCALPEIELLEVMQGIADHLAKNKMEHLIDQCFEVGEEILDDLREDVFDLENEVEALKKKIAIRDEKLEKIKTLI